jgi:hypothetical protein
VLAVVLAAASWPVPGQAAEFDRTVPATRGMRLDVRLFGGAVVIQGGARENVRVRGRAPHPIDFAIDVPAWMAVDVAGTYLDIRVDGAAADITADTVSGNVKFVDLTSRTVDVATVGGGIEWDGTFADGGRCQFVTHSGDIDLTVPASASARIVARAFTGTVRDGLSVAQDLASLWPRSRLRISMLRNSPCSVRPLLRRRSPNCSRVCPVFAWTFMSGVSIALSTVLTVISLSRQRRFNAARQSWGRASALPVTYGQLDVWHPDFMVSFMA